MKLLFIEKRFQDSEEDSFIHFFSFLIRRCRANLLLHLRE